MLTPNFFSLFGTFVFFFPFFSLFFVSEKKKYFLFLVFLLISSYSLLFVILQFFKIFYHSNLLFSAILFDLLFLIFFLKKRKEKRIIFPNLKEFFFLALLILISFLNLYQVHWKYTGKINLATDLSPVYHEVKNMKYPYPYFSDEWYAIAFVKEIIKSKKLPLWDPLNNNFFYNFEMFFHSFLAEIFLLLKIQPLVHYTLLSIFINALIILLVYLFLRVNNLPRSSSAIFSLSCLYLTCGANLPGFWHLIPVHLGIVYSLLGFCFLATGSLLMAFGALIATFLFYPPLFPFLATAIFVFIVFESCQKIGVKKTLLRTIFFLVSFVIFFFVLYQLSLNSPLSHLIKYIQNRLIYTSFYGEGFITKIAFYHIIPFVLIPFGFWGMIVFLFKKEKLWLLFPLLMGILWWFFYSFTSKRFLIEFERLVFLTSILFVIVAGFGWEDIKSYLKRIKGREWQRFLKYVEIMAILFFILAIPFYTRREGWRNIIVENPVNRQVFYPKAPANNYLTDDDLNLFKDIKNKTFLSLPWKGTVIGVATDNSPLIAKEGTLSKGDIRVIYSFLDGNCEKKRDIVNKLKIEYIYLTDVNCPGFRKVGESKEGLVLYQVER